MSSDIVEVTPTWIDDHPGSPYIQQTVERHPGDPNDNFGLRLRVSSIPLALTFSTRWP